jgi:murein DD-endopeptidase MepM/ murein hydrolase activator NlpD
MQKMRLDKLKPFVLLLKEKTLTLPLAKLSHIGAKAIEKVRQFGLNTPVYLKGKACSCAQAVKTFLQNTPAYLKGKAFSFVLAVKKFCLNAPGYLTGKARSLVQAVRLFLLSTPAYLKGKACSFAQFAKKARLFLLNAPASLKSKAHFGVQMAKIRAAAWRCQVRLYKRAFFGFLFSVKTLISLTIILGIATMSVTAVQGYYAGFGTVVLVNEEEVGFLHDTELAELEDFIASLELSAQQYYRMNVQRNEDISFMEDRRPGQHMDVELIKGELEQRLSFSAMGYILSVDGQEMVTLASMEDYESLLEIISTAYITERKNTTVVEVDIQENLVCEPCPVAPEDIISVEDAASILLTGTTKREIYLVSRGDSLWTIARANNMSVSQLQSANPQVNGTSIHPGDELNLIVAEPIINVSVVEERTVTEKIPFKTTYTTDSKLWRYQTKVITKGSNGERQVSYKVTLENGQEVDRVKIDEKILKEPVTQVVARGTANAPALGSGRFAWPLASGGRITSPYGWRWGKMHYGVDIAAPTGTAIRAADSGVVSFSGYRSSYGNLVILDHGNGYTTYYAHNSKNLVVQGDLITKGNTIALIGMTGFATGPHVHFEIRYNGKPMDPMKFF